MAKAGVVKVLQSQTHVQVADKRHGIGISDLKRIKVIRLGHKEGILLPDKV